MSSIKIDTLQFNHQLNNHIRFMSEDKKVNNLNIKNEITKFKMRIEKHKPPKFKKLELQQPNLTIESNHLDLRGTYI